MYLITISFLTNEKWVSYSIDSFSSYEVYRKFALGLRPYIDFSFYYGPVPIYVNGYILKLLGPTLSHIQLLGTIFALLNLFLFQNILTRLTKRPYVSCALSFGLLHIVCFNLLSSNTLINWVFPQNFANIYSLTGALLLIRSTLNHFSSRRDTLIAVLGIVICTLSRFEWGLATLGFIILIQIFNKELLKGKWPPIIFSYIFSILVYVLLAYKVGVNTFLFENIFWIVHIPSFTHNPYQVNIIGFNSESIFTSLNLVLYGSLIYISINKLVSPQTSVPLKTTCAIATPVLFYLFYYRCFFHPQHLFHKEEVWSNYQVLLNQFPRCLPFVAGLLLVKDWQNKRKLNFCFGLFALACMSRILFKSEIHSYMYYMAVPPILYICGSIFNHSYSYSKYTKIFAFTVFMIYSGLLGVETFSHLSKKKNVQLIGEQRILFSPSHSLNENITSAIQWINENLNKEQHSILPIPESAAINYFTNTNNPLFHPHYYFAYFNVYGEEKMIQDIESNEIDYIIIVHDYRPEIGSGGLFGYTFAKDFRQWIYANYELVQQFGPVPHIEASYTQGGVQILKRKNYLARGPRG